MKKRNVMLVALGCVCFFLLNTSIAQADNGASTANQVTSELQQSGVITQDEANSIKSPLKNMAEKGATKEELKSVVTKLSNNGIKGDDLKQSVNSMKDLVNKGENHKEAGSIVSQAVAQAHAQGLTGKDLAAKVHEAIQQRKAIKDEAKKKADEAKKKGQEKTKKTEKETNQKGKKKGK